MTNWEITGALFTLSRAMMAQLNRDFGPKMDCFESTMTYIFRDFVRMNRPILLSSKVGEDP